MKLAFRLFAFATVVGLPAAAHAQARAAVAAAREATVSALPESEPAVRAALELPREEPGDYLQAVSWLIDLRRPELAKQVFDELAQLQLTDAQRAALVEEFGSRVMLQVARTPELAPAGAQFADACLAAAAAAARDPRRIAALVAQLSDPSAEVRNAARLDLAATGEVGAAAVLESLARETDPQRRAALVSAAVQMHPLVDGPLLAMLDTRDPALREVISSLLRHLQVTAAAPFLPADSVTSEIILLDTIDRITKGVPPFPVDADNQVELWWWDDSTKKLSAVRFPADEARTMWLARLWRELVNRQPDNTDYVRPALIYGLEAAALGGTPLGEPSLIDTAMLSEALGDALVANLPRAAVALADALAKRGDEGILYSRAPHPSPLANALVHPNRRVRFAALRAIMALDPKSPYPGSSRVPEALAYFAASSGDRRAIVAMPTTERASDLAGKLAAHGLAGDGFNNGRDAVNTALDMSDLELMLVDVNTIVPEIRQTIYELRIHATTGQVPIALLAADGRLEAAQKIADDHSRVYAVPRPHTPEALAAIVARLQQLAGREAVPAAERAAQAVEATTWISQLLAADRPFYMLHRAEPVIEAAVYQPESTRPAMAALVELGTPESQQALVNFATQTSLPPERRAEAVAAFRQSVDAHGVLLTTDEIIAQYNLYNATAKADADTQRIHGGILDAIEAPRAANPPPPPWKIPPP